MNETSKKNVDDFFHAISAWRSAYAYARLVYLASRQHDELIVYSARIYLSGTVFDSGKPGFKSGFIEAGQCDLAQEKMSVEQAIEALVSPKGLVIDGVGALKLPSDENHGIYAAPPSLLHPDGLNAGNRLAVLSIVGSSVQGVLAQPETDWLLKAADKPFDSISELSQEYRLGTIVGDRAMVEIIATTALQVFAKSKVIDTQATLGVWMARSLKKEKAKIGYRVIDKGNVISRDSISGLNMTWIDDGLALVGTIQIQVPKAAVIQCIASYDGYAQQVQWRADPDLHQNPREAALFLIDPSQEIIRGYLRPEIPLKSKAADDFEAAVGWLLWALGFSTASFGSNAKTRDAFDTIAVTPNGDFLVVESTVGLLRADSKLSKLGARAASLRERLSKSNLRYRVLPVIVTAMTREQITADLAQAEEIGVMVLTSENVDDVWNELIRYPNADALFERAWLLVEDKKRARTAALSADK